MEPNGGRGGGWQDFRWKYKQNRIQHTYDKRKNEFKMRREKYRNSGPYKKINKSLPRQNFRLPQKRRVDQIRPLLPPVDPEEEERKKKLTDTANKLLSKIKTWSAEYSEGENPEKPVSGVEKSVSVTQTSDSEGKPKRIAHSKSKKLYKKPVKKPSKKSVMIKASCEKYDVNKDTVKDFQNRIQQKLINEIMQMPKESLQNVLNDPKINPIMEVKMSRLVRENKLVIAQRLRALAESKMSSTDFATSSQLLADIDKLIDPVIETNLSVLPYELIQQMENIFQVQFDYSNSEIPTNADLNVTAESSINVDTECDSGVNFDAIDEYVEMKPVIEETLEEAVSTDFQVKDDSNHSLTKETDVSMEEAVSADFQIKDDSNHSLTKETDVSMEETVTEDSRMYECSTDEDDEAECNESMSQSETVAESSQKETGDICSSSSSENIVIVESAELLIKEEEFKERIKEAQIYTEPTACSPAKVSSTESTNLPTPCIVNSESNFRTVETQTGPVLLYGVPLPSTASDKSSESLLEEIENIQKVVNKLNERRFNIFLELAKTNPSGSFLQNHLLRDNFLETFSNGSVNLVDSLNSFLKLFLTRNRKFFNKTMRSNMYKKKKAGNNGELV